jgi:hypothetical protein
MQWHGPVLEIGSININGSARDLWGNLQPYHGVDIVPGPGVDYVLDIRDIENPAESVLSAPYRTILCTEVLEHVDPATLVPAMLRFCHGRSQVLITCAGPTRQTHSADGAPELKPGEYYKNVDPDALRALLIATPPGLKVLTCVVMVSADRGDVYAHAEYQRM